jgi:hypothetical protein
MNRRDDLRRQRQAALLLHMKMSRAQFLAKNLALREAGRRGGQSPDMSDAQALTPANIARALMAAPRVTLLASVALGIILIGPKRVVPVIVRAGLTSLIARNVRALVEPAKTREGTQPSYKMSPQRTGITKEGTATLSE